MNVQKINTITDPTIENHNIQTSHKLKILGITLDENVNYAEHTEKMISKLAYIPPVLNVHGQFQVWFLRIA